MTGTIKCANFGGKWVIPPPPHLGYYQNHYLLVQMPLATNHSCLPMLLMYHCGRVDMAGKNLTVGVSH